MKSVKLSGSNPKLMDNPHVFDQVNQHTDFILVDDCDRYLNTVLVLRHHHVRYDREPEEQPVVYYTFRGIYQAGIYN
ncbi:hypothetical protein NXX23_09935 [Bacteroides ovatus]|nr:hypothetical protein [Bacteroides ovatus]